MGDRKLTGALQRAAPPMRTLVVIAAVIALAAICAAAPANGTNSIFVFAGNTSNGALWSPPVFDEAEGKCKYSKNKALYVTANVTVNGTAIVRCSSFF